MSMKWNEHLYNICIVQLKTVIVISVKPYVCTRAWVKSAGQTHWSRAACWTAPFVPEEDGFGTIKIKANKNGVSWPPKSIRVVHLSSSTIILSPLQARNCTKHPSTLIYPLKSLKSYHKQNTVWANLRWKAMLALKRACRTKRVNLKRSNLGSVGLWNSCSFVL